MAGPLCFADEGLNIVATVEGPKVGANIEERRREANDFARRLAPVIEGMKARGRSLREIVAELNTVGLCAPRGGAWGLVQVQRLCKRISGLPFSPESRRGST